MPFRADPIELEGEVVISVEYERGKVQLLLPSGMARQLSQALWKASEGQHAVSE